MKSTKLATRTLGGILAVLITSLMLIAIDRLALHYDMETNWGNAVMAKSGPTTGKGAS